MNLLSYDQVIKDGIEFAGDVCFSGESGYQVYDKEIEDGGKPINGILYELYPNGTLRNYAYYKDGMPNGERVNFYENGKIEDFGSLIKGTIEGEYTVWYENGVIQKKEFYKYGIALWSKEMDMEGNIIKEKTELSDSEKKLLEKYIEWYE